MREQERPGEVHGEAVLALAFGWLALKFMIPILRASVLPWDRSDRELPMMGSLGRPGIGSIIRRQGGKCDWPLVLR